jgi:hypothetical protein
MYGSYISLNNVDRQDNYVNMQYNYVNMKNKYVNAQEKKSNQMGSENILSPSCDFHHVRYDLLIKVNLQLFLCRHTTYLCRHITYLCRHATSNLHM